MKKINNDKEYNYKLRLVFDRAGKKIVSCRIGYSVYFYIEKLEHLIEKDEVQISRLNKGSIVKMTELKYEKCIAGFVICGVALVKESYCNKIHNTGVWSHCCSGSKGIVASMKNREERSPPHPGLTFSEITSPTINLEQPSDFKDSDAESLIKSNNRCCNIL